MTTPACTTASRSAVLISTIASMRSSERITPPSTALAPPDRPVPAPRGTIGTPAAAHALTTAATSAVLVGRTSAIDFPASAHAASSRA